MVASDMSGTARRHTDVPRLPSSEMASALNTPIVLDAIVSVEKLGELLSFGTEYPELDFKQSIGLASKEGFLEFTKDVGAMQARGGYIVAGVDGSGTPTGDMNNADLRLFDEAALVPKLRKYLPDPIEIRIGIHDLDGSTVVLIYVGRHPNGYAIFHTDGQYDKNGTAAFKFRAGEAFWRDGTRSVRITQQGMEEIFERRLVEAKVSWLEEHQQMVREGQAELLAAYESRRLADAPLGTVNLDLPAAELTLAALELVRADDTIALRHLLNDAVARARGMIERDEIETELADVLDKLTCLAATFMRYGARTWFDSVIATMVEIYALPLGQYDDRRFSLSTGISPEEKAPRVFLLMLERIYGLGALAARLGDWTSVRTLTLQLPERVDDYWTNWLHHALVMAARAQHLQEQQDGRTVEISVLSLGRNAIARLECLRLDGVAETDEAVITSLAQFDFLSNVAAIDGSGDTSDRAFWPSFGRFRQERIQPVADKLVAGGEIRSILFTHDNRMLAEGLLNIGRLAHRDGFYSDGFMSWDRTPVGDFIVHNLPQQQT
jgi:hypothetical protein